MTQANIPKHRIRRAGFGGGCHWCTEAVFQSLRGVVKTEQGWIKSCPPHDYFSEAVIVHFNPALIQLPELVTIHLFTHSAASRHSMRKKYRSAVYYFHTADNPQIQQTIQANQTEFDNPLITLSLPFAEFKASPEQYQNYYLKNHQRPFCTTYISPKLQTLMMRFNTYYQSCLNSANTKQSVAKQEPEDN